MLSKKLNTLSALTIAIASMMAFSAHAKPPTLESVKKALPEMNNIQSVKPTPLKGIYEVIGDSNVVYVTEDLDYILSGHILDVKTKSSLTEPVVKRLQQQDIERQVKLVEQMKGTIKTALVANQKNFIKEVKGNGKDILYMVTDARCGFCRAMEKNLEPMTDITIYRIPVAFLGENSLKDGNAAWCAKDRVAAWKTISNGSSIVAKEVECTTPLKENTTLVDTWKVKGTPAFFRADGERWSQGLMSTEVTKVFIEKGPYAALQAKEKEAAK